MLTLITGSGGIPLKVDDYYVRQLWSGYDEVVFPISIWDGDYTQIQEESGIREESDFGPLNYLVKAIDGGGNSATIKCQLDLDEWKSNMTVDYNSGSLPVGAIIQNVAPPGWTVQNASGVTYSRTIALDSATPLDVCEACRSTFNVTFRWNNTTKIIRIVNPDTYQPIGAFVTRDLNLKENNYKGKSTNFATRLYAYGKDGLSFASINGGKPYVENNTYSSRVICAYWKDERYTVAENLLADAQTKIDQMAIPQRSFDCNVVDLANTNPDKYGFEDFSLFNVVALIDPTRSDAKINHQVSEVWRYPYYPAKNKVILSTAAPRIQSQVVQISQAINNPNSTWAQQQAAAVQNATDQITGANGGYVVINQDANGKPFEILIMDTASITTAQKVWRWNSGGLGYSKTGYAGPYGSAMTQDGQIVADFITTGTLNAAEVSVINLIADHVNSVNGNYSMEMWAAALSMKNGSNLRLRQYVISDGTSGIYQVFSGNVDANGNRGPGSNYSYLTASSLGVGEQPDGVTYTGAIKSGTIQTGEMTCSSIDITSARIGLNGSFTAPLTWEFVKLQDGTNALVPAKRV